MFVNFQKVMQHYFLSPNIEILHKTFWMALQRDLVANTIHHLVFATNHIGVCIFLHKMEYLHACHHLIVFIADKSKRQR